MTRGFAEKYGLWAFVAGASTGIGAVLSHEAARRGLHVLTPAHNLGGYPRDMVSFVSIVGL